ncbi:hypothetical protein NtB2_00239 [Lactococcus termiticola]|uniref:Uncharacterized protein n=1 Tax=Lactococcus termiticola TaxID=2169526 RepID=A0A2R5HDH7_9LACT|nr:hypothetical protein NtB2_00239 [Lactococcus termiticola]
MASYLESIQDPEKSIKETGLSGLLILFEPISSKLSLRQRQFMTWELLEKMKIKFEGEHHIPPTSDDFSFDFLGETWFINFSSEAYQQRISRKIDVFVVLAVQAFSMSDAFFESDNEKKAKAQSMVRSLAQKFDHMPVHPGLGPIIGKTDKPTPMKLSYYIGDKNDDPSFEPWKYQSLEGLPIYIDKELLTDKNIEQDLAFLQQYKQLEVINIEDLELLRQKLIFVSRQKVLYDNVHSLILSPEGHIQSLVDLLYAFEEVGQ